MTHLFPNDIRERLLENGRIRQQLKRDGRYEPDFVPVVKLFTAGGYRIWLLTELDPDAPDIGFGLSVSGKGFPELESVSISKIEAACALLGFALERDV